MNRIVTYIRLLCLIGLMGSYPASLQAQESVVSNTDSIKVSLLTCTPGDKVYEMFGHTALHLQTSSGIDVAVNYGLFSFDTPFFIPKFVLGITDYSMGLIPYYIFIEEYRQRGSGVYEQELNLSLAEKQRFVHLIEENALPQNRIYRYNYFYDNCTTRARDILAKAINGEIQYHGTTSETSYRKMIHECNEKSPWNRWGEDFLLGIKADLDIDRKAQQFLPQQLQNDFQNATIDQQRALVKNAYWVTLPQHKDTPKSMIPNPNVIFIIAFLGTALLISIEIKRKHRFWIFDMMVMFIYGVLGILLFVMLFSQHPTVNINFLFALFNPLWFYFLPKAYRCYLAQKQQSSDTNTVKKRWLYFTIVSLTLFIIGGVFQTYPEGISYLAYILLCREIFWMLPTFKKR